MNQIIFAFILSASLASASTFHVQSVTDHLRGSNESSIEPSYSKIVVGTIDDKKYTLQEYAGMFSFAYDFEVGADYPFLKMKGSRVSVTVPAHGKGHSVNHEMTVLSVAEIEP